MRGGPRFRAKRPVTYWHTCLPIWSKEETNVEEIHGRILCFFSVDNCILSLVLCIEILQALWSEVELNKLKTHFSLALCILPM